MATQSPPQFNLNGIYVPQLAKKFVISKSELYDYYSTNSGMYPKNPGTGGGGGGGGDTPSEEIQGLKNRMDAVEEEQTVQNNSINQIEQKQAVQSAAAKESINALSCPPYILSNEIDEVEDIIVNQQLIRNSQEKFLSAF